MLDPEPLLKKESPQTKTNEELSLKEKISHLVKPKQIALMKDGLSTQPILSDIVKKSRSSILEKGINVLYMAFGFLKWKEKENGKEENYSPLVLVPVTIKRESRLRPYYIELYDEEAIVNPSLSYKLKRDYSIELPLFSLGESLSEYFTKVTSLIAKTDWVLVNEGKIGLFAFFKLNMYMDLKDHEKQILENRNVQILLGKNEDPTKSREQEDLSQQNPASRPPLHNVVDADSSQIDAIWQVKNGESIVLQGPPGTGKSQTITNIISECLYDGKKVLFVSEKLAALEVVFQNLSKAGLSDFCLELHSSKTSKKSVISELNRVLKLDRISVTKQAETELDQWTEARRSLDEYARVLHQTRPNLEKSLFELINEIAGLENVPKTKYIIPKIAETNAESLKKALVSLEKYVGFAEIFGADFRLSEWYGYLQKQSSYEVIEQFVSALEEAIEEIKQLLAIGERIQKEDQLNLASPEAFQKESRLRQFLSNARYINAEAFRKEKQKLYLNAAKKMKDLTDDRTVWLGEIDSSFRPEILEWDHQTLYDRFQNRYSTLFRYLMPSYKKDLRLLSEFQKDPNRKRSHKQWRSVINTLERLRLGKITEQENLRILIPLLKDKEIENEE